MATSLPTPLEPGSQPEDVQARIEELHESFQNVDQWGLEESAEHELLTKLRDEVQGYHNEAGDVMNDEEVEAEEEEEAQKTVFKAQALINLFNERIPE